MNIHNFLLNNPIEILEKQCWYLSLTFLIKILSIESTTLLINQCRSLEEWLLFKFFILLRDSVCFRNIFMGRWGTSTNWSDRFSTPNCITDSCTISISTTINSWKILNGLKIFQDLSSQNSHKSWKDLNLFKNLDCNIPSPSLKISESTEDSCNIHKNNYINLKNQYIHRNRVWLMTMFRVRLKMKRKSSNDKK